MNRSDRQSPKISGECSSVANKDKTENVGSVRFELTINLMSKLIVIIDDDSEDLEFLRSAILSADPSIICTAFTSPQDALQSISGGRVAPDVICVDYNMPVVNGVECLRLFGALRILNHTSMVASSSYMPPSLEDAFREQGARYVFEKPHSIHGYQKVAHRIVSEAIA